jgi:hypothetical protein
MNVLLNDHASLRETDPDRINWLPILIMPASGCDGLYRQSGSIRLNGGPIPFIEPARPAAGHMDFDRAVCGCGLKEFARRPLPGEWLDGPGDGVLVREIRPGVRLRLVFEVLPRASA